MKIFNVFGFFLNKKQPKKKAKQLKTKTKQPKTESRHVHKQLKELNQGQVSNTNLRESFLTHIAWVFGFVGENPCEAECIWGITPIFWERLKSCKFLSQANKLKFFKRIWNNLYGLMVGEISSLS